MRNAEQILSEQLVKRGFLKKGKNIFSLLKNDIIVIIGFEKPTNLLYIQFAIIPLFLPCPGYIYYSYGNRLNNAFLDVGILEKGSNQDTVQMFCKTIIHHIDNDLLPFAKSISYAEMLCAYMEKRKRLFSFSSATIVCPPEKAERLVLYGYLYLKLYDKARKATNNYVRLIKTSKTYTEELKTKKLSECEEILELLSLKRNNEIAELIDKNIKDNLELISAEDD